MANIKGAKKVDTRNGTSGDDFLNGGNGDDLIFGLAGNDTISGGNGQDQLFGDAGNDILSGGNGQDQLFGGEGNDTLSGDNGQDQLFGGEGNDTISGGNGQDEIFGGAGNDILSGGNGNDVFVYLDASDSPGSDVILDFDQGNDTIDLRALRGPVVDLFWGNTTPTVNGVWYLISGTNTSVFADTDGNGLADLTILLVGRFNLTPDDFLGVGVGAGDTTAPTVAVDIVDLALNDADNSSLVTFEFSEDVTGFDAADLTPVGGALSGFTALDGNSYTAIFTATDGTDTTGSVTVGTGYTDAAGNTGTTGSDTVDIDTLNPTVAVDIVDLALNDADNSSLVTFEFSEDVTGFDAADLTPVGGALSGFTALDGNSYTAIFTATDGTDTTGSVTVGTGYTDAAGNTGTTGSDTVDIDTLNPTVAVDIVDLALNDADNSSLVTFEFSEDVTGFDAADLTPVGGALSGFTALDGNSYTAIFTATDGTDTTGSVTVGTGYTDAAGNTGTTGSDTVDIDTLNPTVAVDIVDLALNDADNSSLVTFEFSEDVTGFDAADLTPVGGALSGFTALDGNSYTAIFTATDGTDTTGSVTVGTGYTDAAGNTGTTGSDTVDIDTLNPTVAVDIVDLALNDADNSSLVTFEFSEDVTGFDAADLTPVGGALSGFTALDGNSYTAIFTATDGTDTTGSVTVGTGYTDAAGNTGTTGSDTVDIDTLNPTVAVDIVDLALNDADNSSLVTFEFSEDVTGFDAADLTPVGGALSGFTALDGNSYTAIFTATDGTDTTGSVTVGTGYTDAAGNTGTTGSDTVDIDTLNPTVAVDIVDLALNDADNSSLVTFEFSEDVTGFDAADLTPVGGALSGFTALDGNSYTAIFTATDGTDTTGSVTVGTGYTDAAGNTGTTGSDTVDIDTLNPTVAVDIVDLALNDADNSSLVTFEFSEDVTGFDAADLTPVGGALSGFTALDGNSYTAIFTATDGTDTTGSVTVGTGYTDAAGNTGTTGSDTVDIDTLNPTVAVDIVDLALNDADNSSLVTFEFSEDVTGFDAADLTPVGGALSGFTALDGNSYTAIFTATDGTDTTGSVTVGTGYTDAAGNTGTTGSDTVDIDTLNPTVAVDIVDLALNDADNSSLVTFEFSEDVTGFDAADLTPVGGALSGFTALDGNSYTAIFTATDGTDTTGSVTVGTGYTDAAGNTGTTGSDTVDIDTLNPTVAVDIVDLALNDADNSSLVTFEFSEDVTGFDAADLTPVGGALSGFTALDGNSYTAIFTATDGTDTTGSVTVGTGYTDAAGNTGTTGSDTVDIDTLNPTVAVDIVDLALNDADNSSLVTFEFSEDVTGFDAADLTPVGGALSGFTALDGNSYTAIFTATDGTDTTGSVTVGTGYTDAAGNTGTTGSDTVDIDTLNPTVAVDIVDLALNDADNSSLVTFEFSEDVTGFDAADLTPVGGALSGFTALDGNSYTAIFTATDGTDTTGSVTVGTGYTDAAGNTGTTGSDTVDIDTLNPTVAVDIVDLALNDADNSSLVTFEFSEDVTGFDAADLTPVGGALSGFTALDGNSYTAIFTATDGTDTTGSVTVGTGYTDAAGNTGTTGSDTVDIDTLNPTVAVDIVDLALNDADNSSLVTFEFSEDVTGFDAADLTPVGGALSGFTALDGNSYTAIFTATDGTDTTGSVTVGTGYTDAAGNTGTTGSDTVDIDTLNPTVAVDIVDLALNDADNSSLVTFEFSEDVTGFDAADLTPVGGALSGFTALDGNSYTAIFTATDGTDTTGSVTVGTGYTDAAGNTGTTGSDTVDIDTLNPTVAVDIVDLALNDADNSSLVTFEFSEDVTGFDAADLTPVGGALSGFTALDGNSYTAIFTATDGTDTTGSVTVGTGYTDAAGNTGTTGSDTVDIDTLNPTVAVDIVDLALNDADNSSLVTFEFSEDVTGFDAADLTPVGGALSGFTALDGNSYTAIFTATDGTDTTGSVTVGTGYTDAAGNTGTTGSDTVDIDTLNPTVAVDIVDLALNDADNSSLVTFEFSEDVTGFDAADLTPVGGALSGFTALDGNSYTAIFTATDGTDTTGSVTVGTGYTDAAGNTGTTGSDTVDIDTLNPTVAVDIVDLALNDADNSSLVTFEFSEDVTGFDAADLTPVGGALSGFTALDGNSYTAIFTATDGTDTTGSVTVGTGYTDAAGNTGTTGSDTVDIDTLNPTVAVDIVDLALNDADNSSLVTFEFSEDVTGFDAADLTPVGGALSGFTALDGNSYTAIFTATDGTDTTGSVTVGTGYTDAAGNTGTTGSDTVDIDTLNPTVAVDIVDLALNDADNSSLVTFEFSEDVTGFDAADLTPVGGALSGFTALDGNSYTAIFTATDGTDTTGSVTVGTGYTDAAGNTGTTGSDTVDIDTLNPTVAVDIVDLALNDADNSSLVTFEFSEDVTGFDAADLTPVGGALSGFTALDGNSYTAIFTATDGTDTTGSVTVGTGYTDAAGNTGTTGSDTVDIDTLNPTVAVDIVDLALNDADNSSLVTFEFSEDVTGFDAADLTPVGGALSGFTALDGNSYTAIFTATDGTDTTGSVTVGTGYTDAAGNTGTTGSDTVDIDTLNPTVAVDIVDLALNDADNSSLVTFEFSEDVTGFDAADLTPVGGALSGFTALDGNSYTAIFTATDGTDTTGSVTVGTGYTDAAGNTGTTGSDTVDIDTLNPTVAVDIVDLALNDADNSSLVTFEFSEDVTGFDAADLTPVGGALSGFTALDGNSYTAIFTATDGTDTTGSVTVGTGYTDAAGNTGVGDDDTVAIDRNEAPIISAQNILYWSDITAGNMTPINRISFQDPDGTPSVRVTLTMDIVNDDLLATTGGGVTVGGSGTNVMTLDGTIAAINAFLFGGSVQWDPEGSSNGDSGTLAVQIDDNGTTEGGNVVSTSITISEVTPSFGGSSINDFSGVNLNDIDNDPDGSGNADTMTTSWWHQPASTTVVYDGGPGTEDITLVFTPDQLAEILADATMQVDLRTYFDGTPTGDTLALGASSWNAQAQNFEVANISLATGYGVGTFSINSYFDPLPPADATPDADTDGDLVIGTSGGESLTGGDGSGGNNGDDVLVGLGGNDTLDAGSGADLLLGGDGDDTLTGGTGNDVQSGGRGADTFDINETGAGNADTLIDYSFVEGDKIDLGTLLDAAFDPGDPILDFVKLMQTGNNITVQVDTDGGGNSFVDVATLVNYGTSNADIVRVVFDSADVDLFA